MAPKRAAALTPKLEAAPVFSTGGLPLVTLAADSVLVAEGEPVEMVLLAPWLWIMEAEAEPTEVAMEVFMVVTAEDIGVDMTVEEASEDLVA